MQDVEATAQIDAIISAARAAANRGDWLTAERLWKELRALEPGNAQAAFGLAIHAMRRGEFKTALPLIEQACAASPNDLLARLTLGIAWRELGEPERELDAIDAALAIDPYFLPAILAKASWFERKSAEAAAALFYQTALKFAPDEPAWPPALRAQLLHARAIADRFAETMERQMWELLAPHLSNAPALEQERWKEAASIIAGRTKPFPSQCNQLHVPRLPAVPFFDTAQFPWFDAIEAATDAIRAELMAALKQDRRQFTPYVAYKPGAPVNQWKELNHSERWSAYHFWRSGVAIDEHLAACPRTAEALRRVDMATIGGLCPNAMFSALAPHTHIPPHTGETNARVVAHLPLIVPDGCSYRVGYERRRWEVGKVLVFDDTIEHEARNDSDELRVVLIFDVWNPHLSPTEREVARVTMEAVRRLTGVTGESDSVGAAQSTQAHAAVHRRSL
ncbi:MAG: aspartyl/asparaginyl beta-hydroxylase domain-containing protein [Hyphomonadaceae bacterium]|nr:aspartyl/asparaginyl beta-hydroxylase domain-containing protein [Hyphomonadaceae bacterium]